MKRYFIAGLTVVLVSLCAAQSADVAQREAMKKLSWWVGQWEGQAWVSMGPGRTDTTVMNESITWGLDGMIILVEGLGQSQTMTDGERGVVHHARAVLSYDDRQGKYRFHSWRTPGGIYLETEPIVSDRGFQWTMQTQRGKMRYTMTLTDEGAWSEIGEFSSDGTTWRPFFGMLLQRTK